MFGRTYLIANESNVSTKLKFYEFVDGGHQLVFEDFLNNTQILEGEYYEFSSMRSNDPASLEPANSFENTDSLVVIFDNIKKLSVFASTNAENSDVIFSMPLDRNLFRHGSYEAIGGDQFLFTITEEDFERAEDCGNPCE